MQEEILKIIEELIGILYSYLPSIVSSILILIIGYIVGKVTAKAVAGTIKLIKGDESFKKSEIGDLLTKAGYPISRIISLLTKFAIYVVTIVTAISVLRIPALEELGIAVVTYVPKLFGAIIVFFLGIVFTEWITSFAEGLLRNTPISSQFRTTLTLFLKYVLYIVLIFMAFEMADIAPKVTSSIAQALFLTIGISVGLTLALLIGLGLREEALVVLFSEPRELEEGSVIEVDGLRGKIVRMTTLMVELETDEGIVVIPKKKLVTKGYKIIKKHEESSS
ncbi:MAG TPA: hypothetical protein ENF55_01075 [Thermoprotei archaeon]|nr:hypothetical protein [Thermoprotei archaeon]